MTELSDGVLGHLRASIEPRVELSSRYELREEIGRGGMGVVHRAYDRELAREVAIKVLPARVTQDAGGDRLRREARIAAMLEHPGIVPVYDVGELADGRAYYVMKLVSGARLDELVRDERSLDRRVDVFLRICEAVAYAHSHGVVHRDLKPENVRVGPFGEVQVLDFGVARVLGTAREPATSAGSRRAREGTSAGTVLGTPGWMAPEQERGELDVDARADVHALGALLARLTDGRAIERHRALAAIVAKATAHARDDRYASASDLADDVRRWRAGEAVHALPEGPIARAWRVARRHRVAIALVLAYVALRTVLALVGPHIAR